MRSISFALKNKAPPFSSSLDADKSRSKVATSRPTELFEMMAFWRMKICKQTKTNKKWLKFKLKKFFWNEDELKGVWLFFLCGCHWKDTVCFFLRSSEGFSYCYHGRESALFHSKKRMWGLVGEVPALLSAIFWGCYVLSVSCFKGFMQVSYNWLAGGFNPIENPLSNWIILPSRVDKKKMKPPPHLVKNAYVAK